jgi:hypothetical protein
MKCFFVEFTGKTQIEEFECDCGCKQKITREHRQYRRTDTGEIMPYPDSFGPGAMYFVEAYQHEGKYRDWNNDSGQHLHVILPNGHPWDIDTRASNCTMKDDRNHRCWIRHGEPPNITVDKNGLTCAAGAGSIAAGGYHGFLRNGFFVTC